MPACWHTCDPGSWEERHELEASLDYIASSRPAWASEKDCVPERGEGEREGGGEERAGEGEKGKGKRKGRSEGREKSVCSK